MVIRRLAFGGLDAADADARVAAAIASTPDNAVVQLQVDGPMPTTLTAQALRSMTGERNVTFAVRTLGRRCAETRR
jgi:hypothetical protein